MHMYLSGTVMGKITLITEVLAVIETYSEH